MDELYRPAGTLPRVRGVVPRDPVAWGVVPDYTDGFNRRREAPEATVEAVLDAMGAATPQPAGASPVLFLRPGERPAVTARSQLLTEDGAELGVDGQLPPDLPLGYHRLVTLDGGDITTVVVSPGRCALPVRRSWGWAVQLPSLRSSASWGIGDLGDLAELARWSAADLGAGLLVVSPLHAAGVTLPQSSSPYSPSSRRFRNPLHLRIEGLPVPDEAQRLNRDRLIDRSSVFVLKMQALEELWAAFPGAAEHDRYCDGEGDALRSYATFCAVSEENGPDWRSWPAPLRHPAGAEVSRFRQDHSDRVRFHQWLQWLLERQAVAATAHLDLVHDLAVGVDPGGADAWLCQDAIAPGIAVGAPPDAFNTKGQNWGLAAFDPWKLRACAYEPFIQTVRAAMRAGRALRVDHVMGLFRLYWVPEGADASEGVYVRYPAGELLDILALESHRAGAYVVGEDLGTVQDEVRQELERRQVLSYRLFWFEDRPTSAFPERALAAVTTHDLPTIAGVWAGTDLEAQRRLGGAPDEEEARGLRDRLRSLFDDAGADSDADGGADTDADESDPGDGTGESAPGVDEVVARTYEALAAAPSLLLAATLEDALGVEERPNMPGTTDGWPNWSLALPCPLEEIERDPRLRRIARLLARDR